MTYEQPSQPTEKFVHSGWIELGTSHRPPWWVLTSGYRYVRAKYGVVAGEVFDELGPVGWQGTTLEELIRDVWHDIEPPSKPEGDA